MLNSVLSYGYSAEQVLKFLGQKYPQMKAFIDHSSGYGYSPEMVLRFLQQKAPAITGYEDNGKQSDAPLVKQYNNLRRNNAAGMRKLSKFLGGAAMVAGAAYAGGSYLAAQQAIEQISGPSPEEQNEKELAQAPQTLEHELTPQGEEPPDILDQFGISKHVKNMLESGNPPSVIASFAKDYLLPSKARQELKKRFGDKLGSILEEQIGRRMEKPQEEVSTPAQEMMQEEEKPKEEKIPLQKGDLVTTKEGRQGRVLSTTPKSSIVEIDNKKSRVSNEDLSKIEEEKVEIDVSLPESFPVPTKKINSAAVSGMTYDPESEQLVVKFTSGGIYLYEDVPQAFYDRFSNAEGTAKTSGQNQHGTWWVGKNPSLGAAFWKEIRNNGFKYTRLS